MILNVTLHACLVASIVSDFSNTMDCSHQAPLFMGFSRKNTAVDCHVVLQGIFPTQGSNLHLMSSALVVEFFTTNATCEAQMLL